MTRARALDVVRSSTGDVLWWVDGATLHRRVAREEATTTFTLAEAFAGISACETHVALWHDRRVRVLGADAQTTRMTIPIEPTYGLAEVVAVRDGVEVFGMSNTGYPIDRFGERRRVTFDGHAQVLATAWGRVPHPGEEGDSRTGRPAALYEGPEGVVTFRNPRFFFQRAGGAEVELEGSRDRSAGTCVVGKRRGRWAVAMWAFGRWAVWQVSDGRLVSEGREPTRIRALDFADGELVVWAEGSSPSLRGE